MPCGRRLLPDLTGQTFGWLTAVRVVGTSKQGRLWECTCACGKVHVTLGKKLTIGHTKSCGCYAAIRATTHGRSRSRRKDLTYSTWQSMKDRCYNCNSVMYHRYGARGISVCDRWKNDFATFLSDMGPRPPGSSIDRINNDGDYTPENCRWADKREQDRNRSTNHIVCVDGVRGPLVVVHEAVSPPVGLQAVYMRVRVGWTAQDAFYVPLRSKRAREIGAALRAGQ